MTMTLPSLRGTLADFGQMPSVFDREFNHFFDDVLGGRRTVSRSAPRVFAPRIDISETESSLQFSAELPGIGKDDVEIVLDGDRLTIKGEKKTEREEGDADAGYRLRERTYGAFQRSFRLPDRVDLEKVDAVFDKGVLTVSLAKKAEQTKKVDIKSA